MTFEEYKKTDDYQKQVIKTLLNKEDEITNKFHNAINNILRLGYNTERGQCEILKLIESVQYSLEELERVFNINNASKEN